MAEALLPAHDLHNAMPRYTQGLMDLGATICLPRNPSCLVCPLHSRCKAAYQGNPESYPVKTRKTKRSSQAWWLLVLRDEADNICLQRRPSSGGETGIWAGLFSPPVYADVQALNTSLQALDLKPTQRSDWPAQLHVLTHRDLFLHPVVVDVAGVQPLLNTQVLPDCSWQSTKTWSLLGLPAPVRKLLEAI